MIINDTYGMTFNDWNRLYHRNGREDGGLEWLKDQLVALNCAIENAEQLDEHYKDKTPTLKRWNYNGKR